MSSLIRKWIDGEGWQTVVDDGGGGGSFNGGTITETLVVANPNVADPAITLQAAPDSAESANSLIRMLDEDGFERWDVDAAGHSEFRVGDGHIILDPSGWLHVIGDVAVLSAAPVSEIFFVRAYLSALSTPLLLSVAVPGSDDHSVRIGSGDVTDASLQLLGINGQTAPLLDVRDFDFNQVFKIGPSGAVTISPSADELDGLRVWMADGAVSGNMAQFLSHDFSAALVIGLNGDLHSQAGSYHVFQCDPVTETLGFYGATPVAQMSVAVSAEAIHAALVTLGLITA